MKNLATFFSHQFCGVTPDFSFAKTDDLFLLIALSLFIAFTQVSPPSRVSRYTFLPVRPRFSTILCKFAHKKLFFRCHPLEDVTRGGPPPDPPSVATAVSAYREAVESEVVILTTVTHQS